MDNKNTENKIFLQLISLTGLALLVRLVAGYLFLVVSKDSIIYLQHIKLITEGSWETVLAHPFHPFYSILSAGLYSLTHSLYASGFLVSLFFGTLTVLPLYGICYRIFSKRVAFYSCLLFAFHPLYTELSVEILTDATSLFFFAMGMASLVELLFAGEDGLMRKFALAGITGIAGALSYLTRPEGIGVIVIGVGWMFLYQIGNIKKDWWRRSLCVLIMFVMFFAISAPYMRHMGWRLTKKKDAGAMMGVSGTAHQRVEEIVDFRENSPNPVTKMTMEIAAPKKVTKNQLSFPVIQTKIDDYSFGGALGETFRSYSEAAQYPLLVIIFFGIVWSFLLPRKNYRAILFSGSVICLYFSVYVMLLLTSGYLTGRHTLPVILMTLPFGGLTLNLVQDKFSKKGESAKINGDIPYYAAILLVAVVGIMSYKTFRPSGIAKMYIREAAAEIYKQNGKSSILGGDNRVAFYSKSRHQRMPRGDVDDIIRYCSEKGIKYVVAESSEITKLSMNMGDFEKHSSLIKIYEYIHVKGFILRVYRIDFSGAK